MLDLSHRPRVEVETGYALWAERLVADGWTPYLLSLMFRPIGGSAATVARVMTAEIERVYATFVTRVVRRPAAPTSVGNMPVWFCSPDYPIYKRVKASLLEVGINDGLHWHASAFQPPISRLREPLVEHFEAHRTLYVRPEFPLDRIDVQQVRDRVGYVTGYGRKSIACGRVGGDATLILPRTRREMRKD